MSATAAVSVRSADRRRSSVRVRFVDTIRLTPGGKGLAYAAEMIGRRKLDLHADLGVPDTLAPERGEYEGLGLEPRYGKSRMDLVKRDFPQAFERYALEDAEIALEYGLFAERFARQELGLQRLPSTIAGAAAGLLRRLHGGGAALAQLLGREERPVTRFHEASRTFKTAKTVDLSLGMRLQYEFGRLAYHGGRNECFYHGPTVRGTWFDYDLPGAYTTALATVRPLDYARARQELNPDAYGVDDVGAAWVSFEFPLATRYPCLPVKGPSGSLFFPLAGRQQDNVVVTPPELALARRLGATVTIHQGIIVPPASNHFIFESFTRLVQSKRREHPRSTDRGKHELWKETGNSVYGQTGQGLRDKRAFDPATLSSKPIEASGLTEPFVASYVTGLIRAVLGEILAGTPEDATVVSATTDGLLVNVPAERLDLSGPLCTAFADTRERLFGDRQVLELKHAAEQLVSVSVRATYTARRLPGAEPFCAKGSLKFDADPKHHNRRLLNLYLRQQPGMTVEHEQLISAREQLTREVDLVSVTRRRRLNLRYDFKRRPAGARMVTLSPRHSRVAWHTRPWRDVEEAETARTRVDGWSRSRSRLILDIQDFHDWEAYHEAFAAMGDACRIAGTKVQPILEDGAAGVLKRWFLRAGRRSQHGVVFPRGAAMAASRALTAAGCPTTKEDVTYALRTTTPIVPHCVALVPETSSLLFAILDLYPEFAWRHAFRQSDHATVERLLAARAVGTCNGQAGE